jgi:hypothetical protein
MIRHLASGLPVLNVILRLVSGAATMGSWGRTVHDSDPAVTHVRGLPVPELLLALLRHGRWGHPGEAVLARFMPWFGDPLVFLASTQAMETQSEALDYLVRDLASAQVFRFARNATATFPIELPWLDVDKAFFIAVAQHAGDDTAVALDYRTSALDPRVVASDIWTVPGPCNWRVVAETFSGLAADLGFYVGG